MKKLMITLVGILALNSISYADVWVNGYQRSDGTQVRGHYRSNPDGILENNYSYRGYRY